MDRGFFPHKKAIIVSKAVSILLTTSGRNKASSTLKVHEMPNPPATPVFTKQTRPVDRIKLTNEYRQALARYYTDLIQKSREFEKVLGDLQGQMAAVSSAGVDQETVACVALQEQTLGDAAQMLVKLRAWATQEQQDIRKGPPRDGALPHVVLAAMEIAYGGGLLSLHEIGKGVAAREESASAKATEQLRLNDLETALQDASTKLAGDRAKLLTRRNQLVTELGARYPHYAWSTLFIGKGEKAASANAR